MKELLFFVKEFSYNMKILCYNINIIDSIMVIRLFMNNEERMRDNWRLND